MTKRNNSIRIALLVSSALTMASSAFAGEVTPERLIDANQEPHNWLMNHRTYDGQRFSPLARIAKDNVKNLKLAYAVPLGGSTGNQWLEATPLVEDGFLYITDAWGVLYKIDVRSGDVGRIVWRMEPRQERPQTNRGAAMWGRFVITAANWPARIVATDKETGKSRLGSEHDNRSAGVAHHCGGAGGKGQDHRGRFGRRRRRARLRGGARCGDRKAAVAQVHYPGARRTRQRILERQY
jgi:hypothetical protein